MENKKVYAFDPKKNKPILAGYIDDNVFVKKVTNKHYHIKLQSYGIQEEVLHRLNKEKIKYIKIISKKFCYLTNVTDWLGKKFTFIRDYGHGRQIFFPVSLMDKRKKENG